MKHIIECPYCRSDFDYDDSADEIIDYSVVEITCHFCEKVLLSTIVTSYSFTNIRKADCLNGLREHDFKKLGIGGYGFPDVEWFECRVCGFQKKVKKEQVC